MAHCRCALWHCPGTAPVRHGDIPSDTQLECAGIERLQQHQGFHVYDAVQSGFAVSYAMPFRRGYQEAGKELPLQYPIRFSAGMQQESFFNFPGENTQQFRPYFSISLF